MKKVVIGALLVIVIAAFVTFTLLKEEKGIEVITEKVVRGNIQQTVTGSGQIKPVIEVKISAQVAGKIVRLQAEEGDEVKKGQLLVALDPQQYLATLERAESSLMSAKANEKKAVSDMKRSKELFGKSLISEADFESVEASYEYAMSNRMQMDAALKESQDALDKTKLYATMDGVVTILNKELGEMAIGATFQEDVIMVVSDLSAMEAVIEVDENDVINISLNDSSDVELDAFPDTLFTGIVTKIANSAITKGLGTQEQVTNFEVTIQIENPDLRFRPGMSTTVDVQTNRLEHVIKVPIQAVTVREPSTLKKDETSENNPNEIEENDTPKEKKEVVFVVEDNHAVARPVKMSISDDTHYAILNGVDEGEEIITGPFEKLNRTLKDGDLVSIKQKDKGR